MNLTIKQIRAAAKKHKYILLTRRRGDLIGINCSALFLGKNKLHKDCEETQFTGYCPANINEYITHKIQFT